MKTKLSLWVFLLVSALFVSCNQDQDCESNIKVKRCSPENPAASEENTPPLEERYESIDVQEYISSYPELFGDNVLVFDSFTSVDSILDELSTMDYQTLREWYANVDYQNDIIESNIIYDSILSNVANQLGIYVDEQYNLTESDMSLLYGQFVQTMSEQYPELCSYDEEYGLCANPLGCVDDEYSLSNNKGIVIIDKVVYLFYQDYLVCCPIDKFILIPEDANITDFIETCEAGIYPPYISEDDISITIRRPQPEIETDDINNHVVKNNGYKLSIYITAYPVWWNFDTNIRGKMIVKNSYYGSSCYSLVRGTATFSASVNYGNLSTEYYNFFPRYTFNYAYRQRTYRYTINRNIYTPTFKTIVTLNSARINMYQFVGDITMSCNH